MSDFPVFANGVQRAVITPWAPGQPIFEMFAACGVTGTSKTVGAWPSANRAIFVPVYVYAPCTVYKLTMENGAVAGEVDAGIYSYPGTGTSATRLASSGKVAMASAETLQVFDIADQALMPGIYFLAFVCSTVTTATFKHVPGGSNAPPLHQVLGTCQMASALPLPETATLARAESAYTPHIQAWTRELV